MEKPKHINKINFLTEKSYENYDIELIGNTSLVFVCFLVEFILFTLQYLIFNDCFVSLSIFGIFSKGFRLQTTERFKIRSTAALTLENAFCLI